MDSDFLQGILRNGSVELYKQLMDEMRVTLSKLNIVIFLLRMQIRHYIICKYGILWRR